MQPTMDMDIQQIVKECMEYDPRDVESVQETLAQNGFVVSLSEARRLMRIFDPLLAPNIQELPQVVLVSPVVSLDDIENAAQGMELEPATSHVINGPGQVQFYRGEHPDQWITEHGYVKVRDSELCRATSIDGWYHQEESE